MTRPTGPPRTKARCGPTAAAWGHWRGVREKQCFDLFFTMGELGLVLARSESSAAFPPAGIAVAAPLLLGWRVWPGVLLGSLCLGLTTMNDLLTVITVADGGTLEGLAAAWLIYRYAGGSRFYENPLNIVKFTLLAGILSPWP